LIKLALPKMWKFYFNIEFQKLQSFANHHEIDGHQLWVADLL